MGFGPSLVQDYCVLESQKISNLGALEVLLAIDRGKECGLLIPDLFKSSLVWLFRRIGVLCW
jgi:hypothetical protein